MFPLVATYKTGYRVLDVNTPVIIRDQRGILFYSTEDLLPKVKHFNLPPGEYMVDSGSFKEMTEPVKYNLIPLPSPWRKHPNPVGFSFDFTENPHKCTINFPERKIIFDNSFKEKPLPYIYFILYHEYGHQFFPGGAGEKWADVFASNCMLRKGYNPSQIGRAHIFSLSHLQHARKRFNIEKLIKANKNVN